MAGKAKRVASRQAQIGRRKKRQSRDSVGVQAPVSTPAEAGDQSQSVDTPEPVAAPPAPPSAPSRPPRPSPVAARNSATAEAHVPTPSRARRERPVTNNLIGAEVRRILGLSGVVMAVIIVLGVVL